MKTVTLLLKRELGPTYCFPNSGKNLKVDTVSFDSWRRLHDSKTFEEIGYENMGIITGPEVWTPL